LGPPQIVIPRAGAKRERRERLVTLNGPAAWALERLVARATKECGCSDPEHYLIPRRNRDHSYDPTRPAEGWRGGLDLAEIEIRPYDLRHHAVSRWLQDPRVSLEAAKAYYGWVSPKMIQRYYHADIAALKSVAAAIDGARATAETQVLHNQHVIDMLAGGLDANIVIESVRTSFCSFDVSPQRSCK
jgi:integrase